MNAMDNKLRLQLLYACHSLLLFFFLYNCVTLAQRFPRFVRANLFSFKTIHLPSPAIYSDTQHGIRKKIF